jgi:hypothetical protein
MLRVQQFKILKSDLSTKSKLAHVVSFVGLEGNYREILLDSVNHLGYWSIFKFFHVLHTLNSKIG